jgi:peptidoglycan/LPS O-acetylase OafA/YrhL
MLLGLLAFAFGRSSGRPLAAIWVLGVAAMIYGFVSSHVPHIHNEQTYWRSDVRLASIFVSGAVYLTLRRNFDPVLIRRWATPVFVGALIVGMALEIWASPLAIYTAGTLCFSIAVALCDVVARPITGLLSSRVLTQVGVWSFSLYLWQQPFYKTYEVIHHEWRAPMFVAAISAGLASFYLVERPARHHIT